MTSGSPASPALVRQLLLDAFSTEEDREEYARSHGARYLVPHRLVEEKMVTKVGPAMSRELLAYLEAPTPWGAILLGWLEEHDTLLSRRYVYYLAALRRQPTWGRGLPHVVMESTARQLGRSLRSFQRDVFRAEEIIVAWVHERHMEQVRQQEARLLEES